MYRDLKPIDRADPALARLPRGALLPRANPLAVSIAPVEAAALACRFPIAWRKSGAEWDLVALTGLHADQGIGETEDDSPAALPLLLRSFPLTVFDDGSADRLGVLVDHAALADCPEPGDGADDGWLDAELERRCQALWTYVQSRRAARRLFRGIGHVGGFVPWDLRLPAAGRGFDIRGLHVIASDFFGSPAHQENIAQHGARAASLIVAHRVSLHRIRHLMAASRAEPAREAAAQVEWS